MKILVVDDDKVMLSVLAKKLKGQGYEVFTTGNGVESLRIISEEKIDLVISDVMMPCISGFTLITMLKSFYFINIPVLLMSANDQEKILLNSHGVDESGFFTKPIDYPRLFERISQCA
jgi:two-component system, NtrC family, response regulator GlrR